MKKDMEVNSREDFEKKYEAITDFWDWIDMLYDPIINNKEDLIKALDWYLDINDRKYDRDVLDDLMDELKDLLLSNIEDDKLYQVAPFTIKGVMPVKLKDEIYAKFDNRIERIDAMVKYQIEVLEEYYKAHGYPESVGKGNRELESLYPELPKFFSIYSDINKDDTCYIAEIDPKEVIYTAYTPARYFRNNLEGVVQQIKGLLKEEPFPFMFVNIHTEEKSDVEIIKKQMYEKLEEVLPVIDKVLEEMDQDLIGNQTENTGEE